MSTNEDEFNVWTSTYGLYNAGALIGYWTPASEAPVSIAEFRAGLDARGIDYARYIEPPWNEIGEELHCFDTENAPERGEMSPMRARELADILATLGDVDPAVLRAWLDDGHELDMDTAEVLLERYRGTFDSLEDWAGDFLEDTGMLAELPEWAKQHQGALIESWARDARLGGDVWTADVPGGLAVFLTN